MSALRPKWFSEVEEGVRERARGWAGDHAGFNSVLIEIGHARDEVARQVIRDGYEPIDDHHTQILALTYVETFCAEMRRRLEEAE